VAVVNPRVRADTGKNVSGMKSIFFRRGRTIAVRRPATIKKWRPLWILSSSKKARPSMMTKAAGGIKIKAMTRPKRSTGSDHRATKNSAFRANISNKGWATAKLKRVRM